MLQLTEEQFYLLWERFAVSEIAEELPDDLEKFCKEKNISFDYFLEEWI